MTTLKRIFHWTAPLWLASLIGAAPVLAEDYPIANPRPLCRGQKRPRNLCNRATKTSQLSVRVVMRTSEQLTAFYLGRGFNRAAIDKILETCICHAYRA